MEDELIQELEVFGLSEKEAHLYVMLLKYGAKTSGELAKMLNSYRMDVYRTLETLDEKGMIEVSTENPTKYAAVAIATAIDSAIEKQAYGLQWMETHKHHVITASKSLPQRSAGPTVDDFAKFKVIKGRANVVATVALFLKSAVHDIVAIISPVALPIFSISGQLNYLIAAANRGVRVRCITDIVPQNLNAANEALTNIELRHLEGYNGVQFLVRDAQESLTTIKLDIVHRARDADDVLFWTDNSEYAQHLEASFEYLWGNSIEAKQRLHELVAEFPHLSIFKER
jgi:sugar-specific transcriptional regulator TrmB